MAEYLDNIYTDEDLQNQEFIDAVSKDLSDITGYVSKESEQTKPDETDPLDEVLKKEVVEVVKVEKTLINDLSNEQKIKILKKPRDKSSIAVDSNNDILCKSWGNYYIEGGDFYEETVYIINEYLEECEKPLNERDFSKFDVGKKNIVEKFKDMDLRRGTVDLGGFLEDVT